jgi:hypothetical protein
VGEVESGFTELTYYQNKHIRLIENDLGLGGFKTITYNSYDINNGQRLTILQLKRRKRCLL